MSVTKANYHVVFVNGKPQAGKDQLILFMQDNLKREKIPSRQYSSIEPVKEMLIEAGVDISAKTPEDRELLSVMGDALEKHSEFRTNNCVDEFCVLNSYTKEGVLFIHMREPENIRKTIYKLQKYGKDYNVPISIHTVFVRSDREIRASSNKSDSVVGSMEYDYVVDNDGTFGDLYNEALWLLQDIGVLNAQ